MLYYNTYFCYLTISAYNYVIRPVRWHFGAAYSSSDLMLRAAPFQTHAEFRLRIWASNLTTYVLYRPTLLPGPLLTMIWVTFEWFLRHPFFVYSLKCKFPALQIWDFDRLRIWVHRGLRIWRQLYGLKMLKIGRSGIRHPVHPARHMPA